MYCLESENNLILSKKMNIILETIKTHISQQSLHLCGCFNILLSRMQFQLSRSGKRYSVIETEITFRFLKENFSIGS